MIKITFERKSLATKKYKVLHETGWIDKKDVSEKDFMHVIAKVFVPTMEETRRIIL